MKRFAVCVLLGLATTLPIVGCAEKTTVEKTEKVETPTGSTEVKTEVTTEKTGDHKEGAAPANP